MTVALVDAALAYAARGWPVFPCRARSKLPATEHGFKDATVDVDQIDAWWGKRPNYNIGIATGHGFDALDVDHPDGWGSLAQLVAEHGPLVPGAVALTPSGGAHYLFAPSGRSNTAGRLPGLDWRGVGGYVVAPPSRLDAGAYTFDLEPPDELPAAPDWLTAAVFADQPVGRTGGTGRTTPATPTGGTRYGLRALEGELGRLAAAAVHTRNNTLFEAARRMGELVAGGELDAHYAAGELYAVALRIGLVEREVVGTIRSGLEAGFARPRKAAS